MELMSRKAYTPYTPYTREFKSCRVAQKSCRVSVGYKPNPTRRKSLIINALYVDIFNRVGCVGFSACSAIYAHMRTVRAHCVHAAHRGFTEKRVNPTHPTHETFE
jgi:hypothetical protein